ncbi:MAG: DUF2341 domain-containing protein, partial [Promethearchaeota archaeon]
MRVKKNKIWFLSILLVGLISTVFLNNLNFENDFNNISVKSFDDNFSNLQLSSPSDKNWWDSSYKYRTPINITNKHTGDLPKGYSVNISVNTSNLFSNGKLRSDGKDLRIVWYNSSSETWLELDRVNDTNFNTANTQILFKTQTSISPSADDTNYYLYYGFEAANDPPTNKSKVYDFFDDFTQGDGDADGWTVSSGTWSVINNEYRQNQLSFDRRTILDTYTVENATIKVRIKHIGVGTMFGGGVMFRYSSGGNFYTSGLGFWGDEVGTGRWTSGNPLQLDGTGTELDLIEDNWYDFRIEMLGNQYDVYLNDSLKNSVTNTDHLNPGQIGFMTYTNQLAVYFDDLKIGLLVATPPILTTGTEEIYGSWFNKNWNYYKKITVTASSVTIPSDYTISLNFDHESLVSAGKSRVDGDDVRIVYWNGSDWEELDRMLDPSSSWNSNSTKIWFKTQAAIAASSFDNNYYLYYSNSFASSPPSNSDNIFFFYDGFESGDLYGWDGNSTGSAGDLISASTDQAYTGNYAAKCEMDVVASPQAMVYEDFPDEMNMIARVPIYLDPSLFITDRLTVIQFVDTSPGWQNLMSVTIDQDMTLYMWNAVVGEAYGYGGGSTISTGTWHTLEFQLKISETAGVARLWLNDSLEIEATSINVSTEGIDKFATGIYWAGDNEPNTVYIDDIYLRVGVDTEPATSLGVEEMFRPSINDFNYYKEITIDHTKVSGSSSLINFPVLISILDTDLYDKVQSTGSDIAFYNGTHWLDHEIELFNQTYSGTEAQLVVWVRIPSLSPTTDTKIYMYYGNSTIGPQENPTGVWDSNYKAVWHLSEDPSGSAPQILDSTLNNYDGTSYGSMTSGDQIAGQIDGSLDFDGSDDEIRLPGVVIGDLAAWTISAWIRMGADTADQRTIYSEGDTGEVEYLFLYVDDTNSEVKFYSETATGDYAQATGSTDVEDNQWHLVTLVQRSRIDRELYVDSLSEDNSTDNAGTLTTDTASIGALNTIWSADWFNGTIDEVRISNIDRSNDWIATQYNNQYDPDSFYTIGDDTGPSVDDFDYYKEITIDHTKISGSSNLIDFPVLISILDTDLHDDVQSNGNDIAFYNGTDWLDHEIEVFNQTYSGTQAQLVAWVRVPSLSPSTDTIIYMYYGNSTMSAQENPTGVWDDNYIGVWHLAEDPTGTVYDSTSNNNNGTSYGSMNSADQVSGKIDGSLEFDGDNDYIDCDNDSSLDITGDITIEFWVNGESFSNDLDPDILTKGSYTQAYSTWINDDGSVYFQLNGDSLFSTYKLSLGNWYKVVCTRSGSNRTIYINGTNDISDSFSSTIETITETLTIARSPDNLNGTLDEIRLSNVARSHDWIATEFENQNEPDSFYSIGIENQVGEDTSPPDITINSPNPNDLFGASAPDYDLTVVDANLDSIWYSLDGGANSTPVSASGTIDQTMWSVPPNGTVTLRFYANDTVGNLNFTEIVVRKDFIAPAITINSPNTNDLYGDNAPSYDLTVVDGNLDSIWYSLDGGTTNSTPVSATGTINLGMWSGRPNGTVTLRFYANDTMGNVNYEEVVVRKDIIAPAITINSPNTNDLFGNNAPSYDLTVVDGNLASIWYS